MIADSFVPVSLITACQPDCSPVLGLPSESAFVVTRLRVDRRRGSCSPNRFLWCRLCLVLGRKRGTSTLFGKKERTSVSIWKEHFLLRPIFVIRPTLNPLLLQCDLVFPTCVSDHPDQTSSLNSKLKSFHITLLPYHMYHETDAWNFELKFLTVDMETMSMYGNETVLAMRGLKLKVSFNGLSMCAHSKRVYCQMISPGCVNAI